jgi:hypothetical protein
VSPFFFASRVTIRYRTVTNRKQRCGCPPIHHKISWCWLQSVTAGRGAAEPLKTITRLLVREFNHELSPSAHPFMVKVAKRMPETLAVIVSVLGLVAAVLNARLAYTDWPRR